jgi:RHH-type proline utilization regulon transcriptional repressor/proline dehydrogenase/delta 1-pyrroline-5-carboxylate dehydrogenase
MCARDLNDAINIVNATPYGLTSGLHSLDEREHAIWLDRIEAGNLYINRGITGAVVRRQPFGGIKESCFGPGAKPGGPNYLMQLMHSNQVGLPKEEVPPRRELDEYIQKIQASLSLEEQQLLHASACSYTFWWRYFRIDHDPSRLQGQDNILRYLPRKQMALRLQEDDSAVNVARVIIACMICCTFLEVSGSKKAIERFATILPNDHKRISLIIEDDFSIMRRMRTGELKRLRLLSSPNEGFLYAAAEGLCHISSQAVMANGHVEMLHYLREVSISNDYHRYGNLGFREKETRAPLQRPVASVTIGG